MKLSAILFFVVAAVVGTACSKDSGGASNTDLITSAAWKYDTAGIDVNSDGFIDTGVPPGYLNNCDKDNVLTFKSDGTGTVDEGPSKCDPANPQTAAFTWAFTGSQTINFPTAILTGISGDVTLLKLTSTELHLSKSVSIGGPVPVNVVVHLKH